MTENRKLHRNHIAFTPIKWLSCVAFTCAIFSVSGCGYKPPGFDSIPVLGSKADKAEQARKDLLKDKIQNGVTSQKNIFGRRLKNDKERIDRLERTVQDMRNEFNNVKPSITRLMELDGEILTLIGELQQINNEGALPATTQPTPIHGKPAPHPAPMTTKPYKPATAMKTMASSSPKKTYQKKSPPPVKNGKASIYDIRIGEHTNRTRIVMDSNTKTGFNVDIDNNEKIAVIDLPQAGWSTAKSKALAKSNFVKSYSVESSGEGHILILQLKRDAKVTYKGDLKSTTDNSRRLVLDLSGA